MTKDPKELAKTLQANGIAFSDKQALDMAKGMIGTGEKVTDTFNERRDEIIDGYKRPSSKIDMNNPYVRENVKRMREAAMQSTPINVQTDYEIPVEDSEDVTEVKLSSEEVVESYEPETVESSEVFEAAPTMETENDSENDQTDDPIDPETEEEAVDDSPVEAKDTSAEESVDLNEMFNFGS